MGGGRRRFNCYIIDMQMNVEECGTKESLIINCRCKQIRVKRGFFPLVYY